MQFSSLSGLFPKNKRTLIIIGLVVFGLLLSLTFGGEEKSAEVEGSLEEYKEKTEAELEKLCSSLDGVGKCTVTLSFSKGAESTYKSGKLTETRPPKILGVAIACRGADSPRVRQALSELFTSLFDIPTNRVAILKLN